MQQRNLRSSTPRGAEVSFVEGMLGSDLSWADHSTPHGSSKVWEVRRNGPEQSGSENRWFVKQYSHVRKFRQEIAAYRNWLPELSAAGFSVPSLSATMEKRRESTLVAVLTAVPGVVVSSAGSTDNDVEAVYLEAGRFLRMLHDVPVRDSDSVPLDQAVAQRLENWSRRAQSRWSASDSVRRAIARARTSVACFIGEHRVACHRDYTPRNWIVDCTGGGRTQVGVIDFEHARLDAAMIDVARLQEETLIDRPKCAEAFWRGYGQAPTDRQLTQIRVLSLLHAISTFTWAIEHGDAVLAALGQRLLNRAAED